MEGVSRRRKEGLVEGGWRINGISRGFFGCPETPPAKIFFKSGLIDTGTDLHQPLTFAILETPLETNSGYTTEDREDGWMA